MYLIYKYKKMGNFKDSDYYKSGRSLENAKIGSIKSSIKSKELRLDRIKKYNENPKLCLNCFKPIDYDKKYNKFCSTSCSAYYNNIKRGARSDETKNKISSSLMGKIVSDVTRKKISDAKKSEKSKNKISNSLKIFWKNNIKAKNNLSKKLTGRIVSTETRSKQSEIMSNKIKNGTFKPKLKSIKCEYNFKNEKIRCDSKVEYSCLNYFEKNYDVIDIKRCDFLIDFEYKGVNRKYNPDFKIITKNDIFIVECKTILSNKDLQRKWEYYYDTIEYKKLALDKYCKDNNFISFNYNKSMNVKFYNNCKYEILNCAVPADPDKI